MLLWGGFTCGLDSREGPEGLDAENESLEVAFSGLIAMGLDSGDGVVNLLYASEDPRGGIFTSLASLLAIGIACKIGPALVIEAPSCLDEDGLEFVMPELVLPVLSFRR